MEESAVKRLLDSADGRALMGYIGSSILKLDTVSDIKLSDPTLVAVEVQARKEAIRILKEMFALFLKANEEVPQPSSRGEYAA